MPNPCWPVGHAALGRAAVTKFERKGLAAGRAITDLAYRRIPVE